MKTKMKPELVGLVAAFGFALVMIVVGAVGVTLSFLYNTTKKLVTRIVK